MNQTRIRLLGGFLVEHDGQALAPIPSTTARGLFAFLVAHRDRRHTRDLLVGTFWPDQPESAGRRRLSQALWQLQTALLEIKRPGISIETTPSDVSFVTSERCWVDVAAFDDHLVVAATAAADPHREIDQLEAAVTLYRGEFLAGFYDDWAQVEWERLRSEYLRSLNRLVAIHKSSSDYAIALSFARRITLHDPLHEEAHREVMRLCYLLGRTNEALQQYERCVAVLAEELGAEPALETRELHASIVQAREKGDRPFAPDADTPLHDAARAMPLIGRDAERFSVLRHLEDALNGAGSVVLIEGPSGIGKSRFLDEIAGDAEWRGLSVLRAEPRPDDEFKPYGALRTALESGLTRLRAQQLGEVLHDLVLSDLARVVPSIAQWLPPLAGTGLSTRAETQHRVARSLRQVLIALADLNPTVLIIDDAQWADDASLSLLAAFAPELRDHGLLLCLGYRDTEARVRTSLWDQILAMDASRGQERIELVSLDLAETKRLIEESLGGTAVPTDMAEGLFLETGGNPLFILETLRSWHEQTQAQMTADVAATELMQTHDLPISGGVAQTLANRLSGLDEEARSVLAIAAVRGDTGNPAVLAEIAALPKLAVLTAIEAMMRRGVLVETEHAYGFAHHQLRRVILDGLEVEKLQTIHREVAETIERDTPDAVEQLAHHYVAAGAGQKAAQYSFRAGERAMSLSAFDTAVHHFDNATALEGEGRFSLFVTLEDALSVLGRRPDQEHALDDAQAAAATSDQEAIVMARRARYLAGDANYHEAIPLGERAAAATSVDPRTPAYLQTRQILGMVLAQAGRPADGISYLRQASVVAVPGSPEEASALCDLGNVLCAAQRYEPAVEQLTKALQAFEELGDPYGIAEASGQLAIVWMEQGEPERAADMYRKALALSRNVGYRRGEAVSLANLGNALYVQGSVVAALQQYDVAADVFDAIGDRAGAALLRANAASARFTILGDDLVEDTVRTSQDLFRSEGHKWGEAFCEEHLAAIALRRGDAAAARDHLDRGLALVGDGSHRWVEVHLRRLGALIALTLKDTKLARTHATLALEACDDMGLRDVAPTVRSILAAVELAEGRIDQSLERARRATAELQPGSEQPYSVWFQHYVAATAAGEAAEAGEALTRSVALLEEILAQLDDEARQTAIAGVPEHWRIFEAREQSFAVQLSMQLPRVDVPMGRRLRESDMIEVLWTVSEPDDALVVDPRERRRLRVARLGTQAAQQGAVPRVGDLATALGISVATVRRDLSVLRASGSPVSTRGNR